MKRSIVVDASLSASWFLRDEYSEAATRILKEVLLGRIQLAQPVLWKYETVNVLKTALVKKRITPVGAMASIPLMERFHVEYHNPSVEDLSGILKFADDNSITAYDAAYICTAIHFSAELISLDKEMLKLEDKYPFIRKLDEITFTPNQ